MTAANLKFFEGGKKLKATEVIAKLQHSERSVAQENALALLHDATKVGFGLEATLHQMVEPVHGLNGNEAIHLYEEFNEKLNKIIPTKTGIFGSDMKIELINNGPTTILLEK